MSRGGTRTGAGRKAKEDRRVSMAVRVKPETRQRLEDAARAQGISLGQMVDAVAGVYFKIEIMDRKEAIEIVRESNMSKSDCPYFSENAPVCDDGECGCFECMERLAELRKKGE